MNTGYRTTGYALPSITGHESLHVNRFLMSVKTPGPDIFQAALNALAWLDGARMTKKKRVKAADRTLKHGFDQFHTSTPTATPMLECFCQLKTDKPLFKVRGDIQICRLAVISCRSRVKSNGFAAPSWRSVLK